MGCDAGTLNLAWGGLRFLKCPRKVPSAIVALPVLSSEQDGGPTHSIAPAPAVDLITPRPAMLRATRALRSAAGAKPSTKDKPRYVRRPLNKADVTFALTVGFIGFPALGLLYFNETAKELAAPFVEAAWRRYDAAAADVWLAMERVSGRDGEVSEAMRRRQAREQGAEYRPVVTPPPPAPPSREEVRELLKGPAERRAAVPAAFSQPPTAGGAPSDAPRLPPARAGGGSIDLEELVAAAERKRRQQQQQQQQKAA